MKTVEFGWPIGMPTCRPLGGGLYEALSEISGHRISRALLCFADGYMVLLHGFINKTQETQGKERKLARDRKRKVAENNIGSSLDGFLAEEGTLNGATAT
ncbi:MAG: type II toxin-antitoxin system RelE/ParE family toxin, partial [Deltaproteobacteria bacterium]|nr:type II toxin-antitoxin system RelE/ParE family toxin [Deltaproteobacteria bacterium]